jgi:uncharacterized protein (TIGR03032 family)
MSQAADAPAAKPQFELTTSRLFLNWLADQRASIAFTTYQTGKLFLLGMQPNGRLSVFERTLERVMGLCVSGDDLYFSTLYQIWRLKNALPPRDTFNGYDACHVPRQSWVTGDVDVHDMAVTSDGQLVFVNTLFNCLATVDPDYNFRPLWQPPWISKLAPEDRCHLNGLALRDGQPRYVTAVSRSDVQDAWRDKRRTYGVIVDVSTNEIVCESLSMPHSPRWYQDTLWVINSGTGYFGRVNLESGAFEPLVFCPGYARGLAFHGGYAIIGLSDRRENRTFQDLELDQNLLAKDAEPRCGLLIVDLKTFDSPHWLRFSGIVSELYDVAVLPNIIRPMAIGFRTDEIRRYITFPQS